MNHASSTPAVRRKLSLKLLAATLMAVTVSALASPANVYVTFQNRISGNTYQVSHANQDFGDVTWLTAGNNGYRLKVADYNGWNHLRVQYPRNKVGSQDSGASFKAKLAGGTEYYAQYLVRFEGNNFDFGKGGKLPGLAGGNHPTGSTAANGNGFTARFMWRENGKMYAYMYTLDGTGYYINTSNNYHFPRNQWVEIRQRVKLNTGNNSNGVLQVWVDGQQVINKTDIRYVNRNTYPSTRIDMWYFSTFYGGSTTDWAPQNADQFIRFNTVQIDRTSTN